MIPLPGGYHRFASEVWHYEDSRPPPSRHISALPLVVTAVLTLMLAGAAHALNGQQLPPQQVNWEWDFGDGSDPDTDNPTEHTFTATGQYLVTVTAEYEGISAGADAALGFDDKVYLGYCGSTWVEYFYRYALDPASPQRTVGEPAYAAMWWVNELCGDYPIDPIDPNGPTYGYDSRIFSPTGGAGMELLDGGAHWGS